jgi:hypothetical protein
MGALWCGGLPILMFCWLHVMDLQLTLLGCWIQQIYEGGLQGI